MPNVSPRLQNRAILSRQDLNRAADFGVSPRLQKGAILPLDPTLGIPPGRIALQYNSDSITRTLKPQTAGEQPDRSEILRLTGPPIETISCRSEERRVGKECRS